MDRANYLHTQILQHARLFFTKEANTYLNKIKMLFIPYEDALNLREKCIAIPTNIETPLHPSGIYKSEFNGTHVTLWNPLPKPDAPGWISIPDFGNPVWFKHKTGTVIPAWNLFSNLYNLMTFKEENAISSRDPHGRFVAVMSPRTDLNLLEVPAFNEAVAIIIGLCIGECNGSGRMHLPPDSLRPFEFILSHDVDLLKGNDFWTQSVRLYRMLIPLRSAKMPQFKNIFWILENAILPTKYYFEDIFRIIEEERKYSDNSSFYFLNGKGGRFGFRGNRNLLKIAINSVPPDWNVGIHYNYNTFLNFTNFKNQLNELGKIMGGEKPISGRAHYFKFDPTRSFQFLCNFGIRYDESVGYPDKIGYRCGVAGPFKPYDERSKKTFDIWELPLTFMEYTLLEQYPLNYSKVISWHVDHLSKIGGALSFLFHPGLFCNPEFPHLCNFYIDFLQSYSNFEKSSIVSFINKRMSC